VKMSDEEDLTELSPDEKKLVHNGRSQGYQCTRSEGAPSPHSRRSVSRTGMEGYNARFTQKWCAGGYHTIIQDN